MRNTSASVLGLLGIGAAVGTLIGIAVGMLTLSNFYPIFQTDKWAAWIQAVGSVIAIIVSALLVNWQLNQQQIEKTRSELEDAKSIVKNLLVAINAMDSIANDFINNQKKTPRISDKTDYHQTFMVWHDGLLQINPFIGIISDIAPSVVGLRSDALGFSVIAKEFNEQERLTNECADKIAVHQGFLEYKRILLKNFIEKHCLDIEVNLKGFPEGVTVAVNEQNP